MLLIENLKNKGFNFNQLPADVKYAVDVVLGNPVSQQLEVLDHTTFNVIKSLFGSDKMVIETNTILIEEPENDGYNTEIKNDDFEIIKKKLPGKITHTKKLSDGGEIGGYKTLLSLFDFSGEWSLPFAEGGWNVIQWDIKLADFMDINSIDLAETAFEMFDSVDGIIAAPPCTDFTVSGAQYWKFKDEDGRTHKSVELVNQVMRLVNLYSPTDPDFDGVFFWAIENPVGRMGKLVGIDNPFYWNPCDYAGYLNLSKSKIKRLDEIRKKNGENVSNEENDFVLSCNAYNKKTGLWGEFNRKGMPFKRIEPVKTSKQGSPTQRLGGKSLKTKELRSNTPLGFAKAFYEANRNWQAHLQPGYQY